MIPDKLPKNTPIKAEIREYNGQVEAYVKPRFGEDRVLLTDWSIVEMLDEYNRLRRYAVSDDGERIELGNETSIQITAGPDDDSDHYRATTVQNGQCSKSRAHGRIEVHNPIETKCDKLRNPSKL